MMLDSKIETCLQFITEKRPVVRWVSDRDVRLRDELWCAAHNHLLQTFKYHRPAKTMLLSGVSSYNRKTKLPHGQRVKWLRRYAKKHSVRFCAVRRNDNFLRWSRIVTHELRQSEFYGPVGERITFQMQRRRQDSATWH
jgi:hypothetical protein